MPSKTERVHPTAVTLLDTVSAMLDTVNPNEIYVDDVLRVSGVSRGSLYHHFGDYPSLIHATLIRRFAGNVDRDSAAMRAVAETAASKNDYWIRIRTLSAETQIRGRASARAERARVISLALTDEKFGRALAVEQDRLTNTMADAIAVAQDKGWVTSTLSPRAIAVFLQAYSLGRAVDDVAGAHLPNEEWVSLIETVISALEQR